MESQGMLIMGKKLNKKAVREAEGYKQVLYKFVGGTTRVLPSHDEVATRTTPRKESR
jgi:hypothetical protein